MYTATMPDQARVIAWAQRGQDAMIRDALAAADLELAAVGAASATAGAELSAELGADRVDDLRQAILRDDADLLWLVAPDPVEADERRLIRERGLLTVSNEPRPVAIADVMREPREAETADFAPLLRRSPGYRSALDALEDFGAPRCIAVVAGCDTGQSTLLARLFDAFDVVDALGGAAEQIDAAFAGPRASVGEQLLDLHGSLTVNVRFAGNLCASIAVSDRAGSWFRHVTIIGDAGAMRIDDTSFTWRRPGDGNLETGGELGPRSPGELIGLQIARRLENLDAGRDLQSDTPRLLALCEAARISCRTGQGETPGKLLELLRTP
jgi:predicted dehydrogenase